MFRVWVLLRLDKVVLQVAGALLSDSPPIKRAHSQSNECTNIQYRGITVGSPTRKQSDISMRRISSSRSMLSPSPEARRSGRGTFLNGRWERYRKSFQEASTP